MLRTLATRGHFGWGLTELARACSLKKATAHRILAGLERERLVHKRHETDRYFLGPLIGELAVSILGFGSFMQEAEAFLNEIAHRYGTVGVLSLRSGDHFVVASRITSWHLKAELNEVGARRPLVTTSGGVAILVSLPGEIQSRIVAAYEAQMARRGYTRMDDVRAMWERSQALGYGLNLGDTTPGLHAVAVPVLSRAGDPFASLTLAAPLSQLTERKCHELVAPLRHDAVRFAEVAARVHPDLYNCGPAAEAA